MHPREEGPTLRPAGWPSRTEWPHSGAGLSALLEANQVYVYVFVLVSILLLDKQALSQEAV